MPVLNIGRASSFAQSYLGKPNATRNNQKIGAFRIVRGFPCPYAGRCPWHPLTPIPQEKLQKTISGRRKAQTDGSGLFEGDGQQEETTGRNSERVQEKTVLLGLPRATLHVLARSAPAEPVWIGERAGPRFRLPV